jgi:hypothetical protein
MAEERHKVQQLEKYRAVPATTTVRPLSLSALQQLQNKAQNKREVDFKRKDERKKNEFRPVCKYTSNISF